MCVAENGKLRNCAKLRGRHLRAESQTGANAKAVSLRSISALRPICEALLRECAVGRASERSLRLLERGCRGLRPILRGVRQDGF